MSIVMGVDQHRAQSTAEWIDLASGQISRALCVPRSIWTSASSPTRSRCRGWGRPLVYGGLPGVVLWSAHPEWVSQ